jgi:FkbM family methyltransferase
MKKIVILVILPDIKLKNKETNLKNDIDWENDVEWANSIYFSGVQDPESEEKKRWAIGYVFWKKQIKMFSMLQNVKVYFIRTKYTLQEGSYEINDNIITFGYNKIYGNIIYKTIKAIEMFRNDYDYIVRGNLNTVIDINALNKALQLLPSNNIFTSPFWEGNSYPFGHCYIISKDIADYLIESNIVFDDNNRWCTEDTADDYEITQIILKKYNYYALSGCDEPLKDKKSRVNKYGIRFIDGGISEKMIYNIKMSDDKVFLYRLKMISDKKYFLVYKYLIRHIWNKYVKERFGSLVFYNEENHKIPHLEYERDEQLLVSQYIGENDVVLELGARYGSVSCIINKILKNPLNQVSVEPDNTVWNALEKNKQINNCSFHIYKGIISDKNYSLKLAGYGSTVDITNILNDKQTINVKNLSLKELQKEKGLLFNVLVADCEGFLEVFLNENKFLYEQLDKIIFECDRGDVCDYAKIKEELFKHNFKMIENGFQCVFIK